MKKLTLALLITLCVLAAPHAQAPAPSLVTGTIVLALDARETPRKLLHARETLNVTPGALTLVYPKWLPGEHAPDGPIDDLVGLKFTAGGKTVPWRRDPVDQFAFHLDIPPGVSTLDAAFDFLSAIGQGGFSSASSETAHLGIYSWNQTLLRASMQVPAGWKFATALPVMTKGGDTIEFGAVSLTTLVDSPVIAGEYLREVPLDASSSRKVYADLVG
ncbi:MAG: peptidase M61, partial [Acidobacteria bacterium]